MFSFYNYIGIIIITCRPIIIPFFSLLCTYSFLGLHLITPSPCPLSLSLPSFSWYFYLSTSLLYFYSFLPLFPFLQPSLILHIPLLPLPEGAASSSLGYATVCADPLLKIKLNGNSCDKTLYAYPIIAYTYRPTCYMYT